MTIFTNRPYRSEADLQAMIRLVKTRPPERLADYPSLIDLQAMFLEVKTQSRTQLWTDEQGNLLGYVIMRPDFNTFQFEVATSLATGDADHLSAQIIAWATQWAQTTGWERLRASSADNNIARITRLEGQGFVRRPEYTLHFERPLDEAIPAPQLPAGFTIRHVEGEHEAEALVSLHRAAFGTSYMTIEGRLSWMRVPEYDPTLDLVAVAPDGALAAYVLCSISEEENLLTGRRVGYTDPVATHPKFQGRGLAKALLVRGLNLLRQRGMEIAGLGTGSWNMAMQATAKSVGYRVTSTTIFFEKPGK